MSENQFIIESASMIAGQANIAGHLIDDSDTTYFINQIIEGNYWGAQVFKEERKNGNPPVSSQLTDEGMAKFFRGIKYEGILTTPSYVIDNNFEGSLPAETAIGALDAIRLICRNTNSQKPKNTFVIEKSQSTGEGEAQFIGHFECGVDNAKYLITQVVAETNNSFVITIHKGDEDQLSDFNPSDFAKVIGGSASGLLASMDVIKTSDDYDDNKTEQSLTSNGAVHFLSTIRDMAKGTFQLR